jgi:uncharacterized protein (DUF927 family)
VSSAVQPGIAQVRQFIERHGEARFAPWGGEDGDRPTINRAGFRKPDGNGGVEYYVLPEVWRSEVCAGFDPGTLGELERIVEEHLGAGLPQRQAVERLIGEFLDRRDRQRQVLATDQLLNAVFMVLHGIDPAERGLLRDALLRALGEVG